MKNKIMIEKVFFKKKKYEIKLYMIFIFVFGISWEIRIFLLNQKLVLIFYFFRKIKL